VAVIDAQTVAGTGQGTATLPSCAPTDGIKALMNLARFHTHYDYWNDPEYADLLAAWELQCHAVEDDGSPIWRALARLIVAGPPGNGKSCTLDQIAVAVGTKVLVECTYPGIRDRIAKDHQVCILDDAQLTFGTTGKASGKVRLAVNTHTKNRVTQDGRNGELGLYGQMAMAGLSSLLAGKVAFEIADTLSRCFVLHKPRKPKGYHVPEVSDAAETIVREKVVPPAREWCATYRDALRARAAWFGEGNPTGLPDLGGGGRGNDQLARSLLAVCDVATYLARKAWREAIEEGNVAEDEEFPQEWDWSARIRKALVFVSGVPAPVEGAESPLDEAAAAFEELWAAEGTGQRDILASEDGEPEAAPQAPRATLTPRAAQSPAPPAPEPSAPPVARYGAVWARSRGDEIEDEGGWPDGFATENGAKGACEEHAGTRLAWAQNESGTWTAEIPAAAGGERTDYAVMAINPEG
jgi:hypothetical protein